jgi:hypothetical protein
MNVQVGTCASEKRALDKDFRAVISVSGTLRNQSNVVNPSIELNCAVGTIATCNYMVIPEFGRKYYITDMTALGEELTLVSGHCDVLATYAQGIRKNTAIVARSATQGNWNLLMNDNQIKLNNKKKIIVKKGFTAFPKDQFSMILITTG